MSRPAGAVGQRLMTSRSDLCALTCRRAPLQQYGIVPHEQPHKHVRLKVRLAARGRWNKRQRRHLHLYAPSLGTFGDGREQNNGSCGPGCGGASAWAAGSSGDSSNASTNPGTPGGTAWATAPRERGHGLLPILGLPRVGLKDRALLIWPSSSSNEIPFISGACGGDRRRIGDTGASSSWSTGPAAGWSTIETGALTCAHTTRFQPNQQVKRSLVLRLADVFENHSAHQSGGVQPPGGCRRTAICSAGNSAHFRRRETRSTSGFL